MQASTNNIGLAYTDLWRRPGYELLNAYKNASALQKPGLLQKSSTIISGRYAQDSTAQPKANQPGEKGTPTSGSAIPAGRSTSTPRPARSAPQPPPLHAATTSILSQLPASYTPRELLSTSTHVGGISPARSRPAQGSISSGYATSNAAYGSSSTTYGYTSSASNPRGSAPSSSTSSNGGGGSAPRSSTPLRSARSPYAPSTISSKDSQCYRISSAGGSRRGSGDLGQLYIPSSPASRAAGSSKEATRSKVPGVSSSSSSSSSSGGGRGHTNSTPQGSRVACRGQEDGGGSSAARAGAAAGLHELAAEDRRPLGASPRSEAPAGPLDISAFYRCSSSGRASSTDSHADYATNGTANPPSTDGVYIPQHLLPPTSARTRALATMTSSALPNPDSSIVAVIRASPVQQQDHVLTSTSSADTGGSQTHSTPSPRASASNQMNPLYRLLSTTSAASTVRSQDSLLYTSSTASTSGSHASSVHPAPSCAPSTLDSPGSGTVYHLPSTSSTISTISGTSYARSELQHTDSTSSAASTSSSHGVPLYQVPSPSSPAGAALCQGRPLYLNPSSSSTIITTTSQGAALYHMPSTSSTASTGASQGSSVYHTISSSGTASTPTYHTGDVLYHVPSTSSTASGSTLTHSVSRPPSLSTPTSSAAAHRSPSPEPRFSSSSSISSMDSSLSSTFSSHSTASDPYSPTAAPTAAPAAPSAHPALLPQGAGSVGLHNLGNTCFMNSILQSLNTVPELVLWFVREKMWKPKASVAPAFSELLTQMWSRSSRGAVNPTNFLNKVARYDSRWGEGRQHDSQEFLHSLLAALQADCNRVVGKPAYRELKGDGSVVQQAEEADSYARSWHDSTIDDLFGGLLQSTLQCQTCKRESHCFDPFFDLSLPIPSIPSRASITVQHCLKAFSELEALDASEAYKCAGCTAVQPATKRLQVWRPPRCLVLTLKRFSQPSQSKLMPRFSFASKNSTAVHISTQPLDLTPYCNPAGLAQQGSPRPLYQLTAVSRHSGSLGGGHYTALGKNAVNGCWYHFDDEHAREENPPAGSSTSAYVLFYQLITSPASSL